MDTTLGCQDLVRTGVAQIVHDYSCELVEKPFQKPPETIVIPRQMRADDWRFLMTPFHPSVAPTLLNFGDFVSLNLLTDGAQVLRHFD